jgi:hypothetical protein
LGVSVWTSYAADRGFVEIRKRKEAFQMPFEFLGSWLYARDPRGEEAPMLRDTDKGRFAEPIEEDNARLNHTLARREDTIWLINRPAMEDKAFEYVYGRPIPRDLRRPLMWVVAYQAKYGTHPTAEKLNKLVCDANDCSRPIARKHIKRAASKDFKLITEERDGKYKYYSRDAEEVLKSRQIINLLKKIDAVLHMQEKDPFDLNAGRDLVPLEVYYNLADVSDFDKEGT